MTSCRFILQQRSCDHPLQHLALLGVLLHTHPQEAITQLHVHVAGRNRLAFNTRENGPWYGRDRQGEGVRRAAMVSVPRAATGASEGERRCYCPELYNPHDLAAHVSPSVLRRQFTLGRAQSDAERGSGSAVGSMRPLWLLHKTAKSGRRPCRQSPRPVAD
jgi:hypothetical protein